MRTISASARTILEATGGQDEPLAFLRFTNADLPDAYCFVNDIGTENGSPVSWRYNGLSPHRQDEDFLAFPFSLQLLTDTDGPPRAEISIVNVDQRIGAALRAITTPLDLSIALLLPSDFDITVNPRVALSVPEKIWSARGLTVRDVSVDVIQVTGTIRSIDDTGEPYPGIQTTQALLPGLYR